MDMTTAATIPTSPEPPTPPAPPTPPTPPAPRASFPTKKIAMIAGGTLLLLLVLGLGALYLQGGFSKQEAKPTTLTYWGLWETPEVMQPLIEEYQKKNPHVTIKYEQRPIEEHYATVKSRISDAGISNSFPDIIRMHNSWVPVLSNYLSPIPRDIYTREEYESVFYPATKDNLLTGGNYYGIPLMMDGLALVYNQELFAQAGISTPPATWDDVRRDAAKIVQRDSEGNLKTAGIAMGSTQNVDHFADIIGLLMAQNNVVFQDANGNVTLHKSTTSDGRNLGVEALSFYKIFTAKERVWDDNMEPSTLAFSKGKVGMILVPSWRVLSLVDQNPTMQIRVAPVPHLTTDQKVGYATYWVETVPKASANQAEAWKFVRFLSEREQQLSLFSSAQRARSFGEPYSRKDLASALSSETLFAPFGSQAGDYRASMLATNTGATDLNEAINSALAAAVAAADTAGGDTTATALNDLAEKITTILTEQRQ